ncbi:putative membrane protein [Corynebacterium ulcerans 809]|uniref:TIGR03943 family putative permease subunit n=1 Tax=Corynebacterium ulcerans TaxID=65058 RepID=UPI00021851F7|nr:TIGR03943 family protein [Corynebacterium ulcerans]AEG80917.1 putative membrane protein [Corynebacterium ulcerans 809]
MNIGQSHTESTKGVAVGAFVIAALGVLLLVESITGGINNYLQPAFRPWTALSGVLLIGLGGWSTYSARRYPCSHSPMRATSWLLLVPVLLVALCAPTALGAASLRYTAESSGATARKNSLDDLPMEPLRSYGTNELTMEELTARFLRSDSASMMGKTVAVTGFASRSVDGTWRLSRYKIFCCAADAMAYTASLDGDAELIEDNWYEITAEVVPHSEKFNPQFPVLKIDHATQIPQPEKPYL